MKIAYLMLVHNNPRLLDAAIRTLRSEGCAFFIHVDQKADIQEFSNVGAPDVFFCEGRVPAYWGEFSLVQATLALIRQALAAPAGYDYFVLLSGSDYPLRSGAYVRAFFEQNRELEFMNLVKMPAPGFPLSKINVLRYSSDKPVRRFVARALAKLGLARRDYRKYLAGLEAYSGSQWWAISREAAHYVVEFAKSNPHLDEYFRDTFTSDEMYFQTILGNSPLRSRMRRNLVYFDWPAPGNHPLLLNDEHVSYFEAQDRIWIQDEWGAGEVLFARKFSDGRLDLVKRIDEMIKLKEERGIISLSKADEQSPIS